MKKKEFLNKKILLYKNDWTFQEKVYVLQTRR